MPGEVGEKGDNRRKAVGVLASFDLDVPILSAGIPREIVYSLNSLCALRGQKSLVWLWLNRQFRCVEIGIFAGEFGAVSVCVQVARTSFLSVFFAAPVYFCEMD